MLILLMVREVKKPLGFWTEQTFESQSYMYIDEQQGIITERLIERCLTSYFIPNNNKIGYLKSKILPSDCDLSIDRGVLEVYLNTASTLVKPNSVIVFLLLMSETFFFSSNDSRSAHLQKLLVISDTLLSELHVSSKPTKAILAS